MNDMHREEIPETPALDWLIEVKPETAVARPGVKNEDDWVDWDQSTIKITLSGSLQSGYNLSDAITSAATFYSNIAVRDRRSNPALAEEHADLARRFSALAIELEERVNGALNALDEIATIDLAGSEQGDS